MKTVLIIDNYDSFVYNIAQLVGDLGYIPLVLRNDEITITGVKRLRPEKIIISPGPGTPLRERDIGVSIEILKGISKEIPTLGICLGHQAIGVAYGAKIRRARRIMHGKLSNITHYGDRLFNGIPTTFQATRYHSLVIYDLPESIKVTAISDDNEVMAIKHKDYEIYGVQFHPESVATRVGVKILSNFLEV
jgi:anthranilate synthase component 2